MNMHRCLICDYLYHPQEGDPSAGITPGPPFSDLPDDWLPPFVRHRQKQLRAGLVL